jgi:hypothetical protein
VYVVVASVENIEGAGSRWLTSRGGQIAQCGSLVHRELALTDIMKTAVNVLLHPSAHVESFPQVSVRIIAAARPGENRESTGGRPDLVAAR